MTFPIHATEKQVEAIAYELAERFIQRTGNGKQAEQVDSLAAAIGDAIVLWMNEINARVEAERR